MFIKPICLIFYLAHIFLDVISGRVHIRYHKGVNWSNFDILCNNSLIKIIEAIRIDFLRFLLLCTQCFKRYFTNDFMDSLRNLATGSYDCCWRCLTQLHRWTGHCSLFLYKPPGRNRHNYSDILPRTSSGVR